MNSKLICFALIQLENNKDGELILPIRKKIWAELGEIDIINNRANIADGIKKRVVLSRLCVEKVKDLWNNIFKTDSSIDNLLRNIEEYMEGTISANELEKIKNKYYGIFEEIAYNPKYEKEGLIGIACIYVANIALYDELLLQNTDDDDLDEDLDSFTWDTSYLISLVYSYNKEEKEVIIKRREFWRWYLNKAMSI